MKMEQIIPFAFLIMEHYSIGPEEMDNVYEQEEKSPSIDPGHSGFVNTTRRNTGSEQLTMEILWIL